MCLISLLVPGTRECPNEPSICYPTFYLKHCQTEWRNGMREKIDALEKDKTWEIVDQIRQKNLIGCKWFFTLKYEVHYSFERYNAS